MTAETSSMVLLAVVFAALILTGAYTFPGHPGHRVDTGQGSVCPGSGRVGSRVSTADPVPSLTHALAYTSRQRYVKRFAMNVEAGVVGQK